MHRDISGPKLRSCFGAARKESTPSKLLSWALEELATAQRDMDITGDMDSYYYYEGLVDAYETIALWIAPLKEEKEEQLNLMLGKTGTRFGDTTNSKETA